MIRCNNSITVFIIVGLLIGLLYYIDTVYDKFSHGVEVKSAALQFDHGNATLNADIDYHFSETALQALKNGIPLPLNVEVMVKRQREWLWDNTEWKTTLRYQVRYLALSNSYEVINESSGSRRDFASRGVAIKALGRIRGMPVAKNDHPDLKQCSLLVNVTLDREGLPLPLRPTAYLSWDWYLSSGWKQWPLTN